VPRLALFGEFSAGKSSIINLLLGRDILPTSVLSSTRRPTYVRYAPDLQIEAISEIGKRESVAPDVVKTFAREDISHFNIGMPNELLRHVEVLDTPGFADPFHDPERTLDVVESADICIWCTLATQAWRQSERRIWSSLPARLRTHGILVVTHIDTLAHRGERRRIRARLKREAGELFAEIVLLAVPDAVRAMRPNGHIVDAHLWRDSGGSALIAALEGAVINYRKARGESEGLEEASWTGIGSPPTTSSPPPTTSTVSTAAVPAEAVEATTPTPTPTPTTPAPETSSAPQESVVGAELQRFLARVMESVPACCAAAWVDLAGREVLQLCGPDDTGEIPGTTALGEAVTELFQGSNVQKIEGLFRRSRGLAEDERHYFQEIVIIADDCVGIFLRDQSRADRSLIVVSDRTVNLGMVLARARGLLESPDRLI
jgi:Dynamin family